MTKMQLDVGVSQPANIMTFRPGLSYLSLTHMTFDPDPSPLNITCKTVKWDLKSCSFDLMTLTFDL